MDVRSCGSCKYKSFYKSNVLRHRRMAHHKGNYACHQCHKFLRPCITCDSMNGQYTGTQNLCEFCSKDFSLRQTLNLHNHRHLRRYQCMICERSFYDKAHYQGHLNMHMGNRGFACKFCPKAFIYKSNLTRHEKQSYKNL